VSITGRRIWWSKILLAVAVIYSVKFMYQRSEALENSSSPMTWERVYLSQFVWQYPWVQNIEQTSCQFVTMCLCLYVHVSCILTSSCQFVTMYLCLMCLCLASLNEMECPWFVGGEGNIWENNSFKMTS